MPEAHYLCTFYYSNLAPVHATIIVVSISVEPSTFLTRPHTFDTHAYQLYEKFSSNSLYVSAIAVLQDTSSLFPLSRIVTLFDNVSKVFK